MALENVRYDAFISYRHCELDSFISENLHKKLESYRLPRAVRKKLDSGKKGIERVFRDEQELPLSSNLSDPIMEALANSEFLIVICTPRLPLSQWCRKEIETFVETHDRKHVLLVLAEGEPQESFPEILTYEEIIAKDETGKDVTVRVDREPLAADCRGANNRQRLKALDNVVVKLVAAIFGLNYDDLRQRHRERKVRRGIFAMTGVLAVVLAFALTCLGFTIKVSRQNDIIRDKYAGAMALASEELLAAGRREDAIYVVRNVLPDGAEEHYNADAYKAMVRAIAPYEFENCYYPVDSFKVPLDTGGVYLSDDREWLLACCDGYFVVIETDTGEEILRVDDLQFYYVILNDTGVVYLDEDGSCIYIDPDTEKRTVLCDEAYELYYSSSTETTLVFCPEAIKGFRDQEEVFSLETSIWGITDGDYWVEDFSLSPDGRYASFVLDDLFDYQLGLVDLTDGSIDLYGETQDIENPAIASDGNTLYLYYEDDDYYSAYEHTCHVMAFDVPTHSTIVETELAGDGFYRIVIGELGIMLVSDRLCYILDNSLDYFSDISGYTDACCAEAYDYGFFVLDIDGHFCLDGVYNSEERSFELYGHDGSARISQVIYCDDSFYIRHIDSDIMVVYAPVETSCEMLDDLGDAEPFDEWEERSLSLEDLEGIDDIMVAYASISDDEKYIAVSSWDAMLRIFDADSGKMVREIYDSEVWMMDHCFPYLEGAGVYVIENGVFDEDFNLISLLPEGHIVAVGEDGDSIILESRYTFGVYYEIRILSYEEMLKFADKLLKGYEPDPAIRAKYEIVEE